MFKPRSNTRKHVEYGDEAKTFTILQGMNTRLSLTETPWQVSTH